MGYADYTKAIGANGTMLVRVADSAGQAGVISANEVQFFIASGSSATWVGSPGIPTSVYYNGGWAGLSNLANYRGGSGYRHLGTIYVGSSQTITFHMNASGTSGLGGAVDFAVWVARAVVPPAPTSPNMDQVTHTSVRVRFNSNGDGGSGVLEWQIGYGYADVVTNTVASSGTTTLTGLRPGAQILIRARGRNAVGWGPWTSNVYTLTLPGVFIKAAGVYRDAVPYVKVDGVWKPAEAFGKKSGNWQWNAVN